MGHTSRPPGARRVTIKDVAHVAGVSVTTVSNVLNGRTEAMTPETLLRVQETIQALDYRPSSVARSLVTRFTATIGVVVAEINTTLFLQALNYIEPIARSANRNVLLCTVQNSDDEKQAVDLLLEKQVDGIIFLSTSVFQKNDYLLRLPASAPPLVTVNRATVRGRFDQIELDHGNGIVQAVDYLVRLGHRHIAHLFGPRSRRSCVERLHGYRLALERHSLPFREDYVRAGDFEAAPETWEASTQDLLALSPRPTAIIAANDVVAAIVLRTVQRAGLRVPQDISIVGIDDQPFCMYLYPRLTTVQLPIIEAGKQAIEMLLARISGERATSETVTLPCQLIVRESSGVAPLS